MTDAERITALEGRLAQAEARIAALEARPLPQPPLSPHLQQPAWNPHPSGTCCAVCNSWVPSGIWHTCGGAFS